jgi:hypothetical protein
VGNPLDGTVALWDAKHCVKAATRQRISAVEIESPDEVQGVPLGLLSRQSFNIGMLEVGKTGIGLWMTAGYCMMYETFTKETMGQGHYNSQCATRRLLF